MARSSSRLRKHAASARQRPAERASGVVLKSPAEIDAMAAAGALLHGCHDLLAAEVRAGVTTAELDALAEEFIRSHGAVPVFKGYHGFPASICPSINEEVVHGIPGDRTLVDGDICSIDVGLSLAGWVADAARTHTVGEVSDEARRLIAATERALAAGIAQARPGNRVGDIGHAVQAEVEADGFAVVRSLVGHGVGRQMHEEPQVPNFGRPGTGAVLEVGTVIAIEPMVNVGTPDVVMGDDGWTISSADDSLSAHAEHTVAVTAAGPRILTRG